MAVDATSSWNEYTEALKNAGKLPQLAEQKGKDLRAKHAKELKGIESTKRGRQEDLAATHSELKEINARARKLAGQHGIVVPDADPAAANPPPLDAAELKARFRLLRALASAVEDGVVAYESARRSEERARIRTEDEARKAAEEEARRRREAELAAARRRKMIAVAAAAAVVAIAVIAAVIA